MWGFSLRLSLSNVGCIHSLIHDALLSLLMCVFEDLQELPFKFQYTETQKQINILKLIKVMGGVCGRHFWMHKFASTVYMASYKKV